MLIDLIAALHGNIGVKSVLRKTNLHALKQLQVFVKAASSPRRRKDWILDHLVSKPSIDIGSSSISDFI